MSPFSEVRSFFFKTIVENWANLANLTREGKTGFPYFLVGMFRMRNVSNQSWLVDRDSGQWSEGSNLLAGLKGGGILDLDNMSS